MASFKQLFDRIHEPDGIRFVGDEGICCLIGQIPEDHPIFPILCGDLLFRLWLYKGHQPENLRAAADLYFSRDLSMLLKLCIASRAIPQDLGTETLNDKIALEHCRRMAGEFLQSDGLIALAIETEEAVPIPFSIMPGIGVRDLAGVEIPEWRQVLEQEQLLGANEGIRLNTRSHAGLEGNSFGLPVFMAKKKTTGELPDLEALDVLATGTIVHGQLQMVDQVEAKRNLAHKMGVVFIAPGNGMGDIYLPVGSDFTCILEQLNNELLERQVGRLSPKQALVGIRQLQDEVHHSSVDLNIASRRLQRLMDFCEEDSIHAVDAKMQGLILQLSIANHQGNVDIAKGILSTLKEAAYKAPQEYLEIRANEVVSLTDAGLLVEATSAGRSLLQWVECEMPAFSSPVECKKAEMLATGVLGGQPLLLLGFNDRVIADESLTLLKRAYEAAIELDDYQEKCRDSVQIVLWYALHAPDQIDASHANSQAILATDPRQSETSEAYLQMIRFLGAYRRLRFHDGHITLGFTDWELPNETVGEKSWPLATSLKYRGVLHAASGRSKEAQGDFERSILLLEHTDSPLLRVIAGTAALEAVVSLPASIGYGEKFKDDAEKLFYNPSFRISAPWLEALRETEIQSLENTTRELRRVFRY